MNGVPQAGSPVKDTDIERAAAILEQAGKIAAFTGAGISAESGIPTFRGDDGIWKKYSPTLYGNIPGLALTAVARPAKVLTFARDAFRTFLDAAPNPGHVALARLQKTGMLNSVVTQNIDNLHERAGSSNVIKLHGDICRLRCLRCKTRRAVTDAELRRALARLEVERFHRFNLPFKLRRMLPRCRQCGGIARLDVVFFGESLPQQDFARAVNEAGTCDVMLIVGTSGAVYPAAGIPFHARQRGARIVEINPEPSPLSRIADLTLHGNSAAVLPRLADKLAP